MARVLIVQPYIPFYRIAFFQGLRRELARHGIELTVAAGTPDRSQALRLDAVEDGVAVSLPTRQVALAGRKLVLRRLGRRAATFDLVVVEQALRNLDAYELAARRLLRGRPTLALWGHGRTYVRRRSTVEEWALTRLTGFADWFFAYTRGGARHVINRGFPPQRVTVVQNTIDTLALIHLRAALSEIETASLARQLRLGSGPTALYLGALDPSKRIPWLLRAAEELARRISGFTLLVAGGGELAGLVARRAGKEAWLRYVGFADDRTKVSLAGLSRALLVPGSVGLVAADSFALGVPIVTTTWPYHGPEFEYLESGANALVTPDDLTAYVDAAARLLSDGELHAHLVHGCARSATVYTLEAMIGNFAAGILAALRQAPSEPESS
jgi:glycosyltransferase involved in cell wall biosynthesis